jgi:general stress protein 26
MTKISEADATHELWSHLKDGAPAMLGLNNTSAHYQPMAAYAEPANNAVWFFARDDSQFVQEIASSSDGRMVFVSRDRECYADITGDLTITRDQSRIDQFWNSVAAAWFPEGKDDPHLTLLCFEPIEGQVWIAKSGLVRMALQVAKANVTKRQPKVGGSAEVRFRN